MAEIVEYRIEQAIPELEFLLTVLFTEDEVKTIVKMRKDLEYKMLKKDKVLEDLIRYIDQEMKLLKMVRIRHKKKDLQKSKLANLEMSITRRINKVFVITIRTFPQDLKVWLSYFRFCKIHKMFTATSRILNQMLDYHGSSRADLYKFAAQWELVECKRIDKARDYLVKGIHVHADNKVLLEDLFRLELIDAAQKRKECIDNNIPIDPTNAIVTSKRAECIYECSIKKLKDVELMNNLLNICADYDFTNALQSKIYAEMFEFDTCERMWDIIATKELNANTDDKLPVKNKIGKCVELYETAVKRLNTPTMWAYYIEALMELVKDTSYLPNYKRKLLMSAFAKAAANGKLTEKHYLIWVCADVVNDCDVQFLLKGTQKGYLQDPDKHKKLVDMLQGAVKQLPQSCQLWKELICAHFTKGEEKQAQQAFEQAVVALGKASVSLWKLMLMYEQTKRNNRSEELFKKSFIMCPEVGDVLKPMYLEWVTLDNGIGAARKVYGELVDLPPHCLEMHQKMIYLETIQPKLNLKRMRCALTRACADFGEKNVGVWIDICKFEIKSGDPERVSGIYWQARQNLLPQMVETFLAEFNLIGSVPDPPPE